MCLCGAFPAILLRTNRAWVGLVLASVTKHPKGWRAYVARRGVRKSKIFPSKREAQDWASRQEYLILNGEKAAAAMTFGELLDRYAREVSPKKRGHLVDLMRIDRIRREDAIAHVRLGSLSASDFSAWREKRLGEVTPSTVRREMNMIGAALNIARKEWKLISGNPMEDVARPAEHRPRDRLPTADELQALALAAGEPLTPRWRAWQAFRFSCETAMRAGEVCAIRPGDVDLVRRVVTLHTSKNGSGRQVPITTAAADILRGLSGDPVFGFRGRQLSVAWRGLREAAGVVGLRYHDARAAGALALSKRLDPFELARVTGHKDINILLNTYYRATASDIAKKLD